jgi:hypothetical protein
LKEKGIDKEHGAPPEQLTRTRWEALHREAYAQWAVIDSEDPVSRQAQAATRRFNALCDEYLRAVPRVAAARCPYSDAVFRHSIDTFGLEGLWWRYHHPIRPPEDDPGPHFLVLTGAARVPAKTPGMPHLVRPGPGVPFVIPRLFELGDVTAVIRGLEVGGEAAWAISYFARRPRQRWPLANTWGSEYSPRSTSNVWFSEEEDLDDTEYDYALRPHLRAGRLLWIAQGDDSLALQRGEKGCPYLGLKGRREMVRVQEGHVW